MNEIESNNDLLDLINVMKRLLEHKAVQRHLDLGHPEVIFLSQYLDGLIVKYLNQTSRKSLSNKFIETERHECSKGDLRKKRKINESPLGHLENTKRLFSENKIVLAGPCLDGAYGIVIFQADSEQEAREIFENDPVVKANIMDVELHPYKVSLLKS